MHLAAEQSGDHRRRAAVGDVLDVDAGQLAKQLAGKMLGRAGADAGEIVLAGRRLGGRDEALHIVRRKVGRGHQHEAGGRGERHEIEIVHRVERQALVERGRHAVRIVDHVGGVAVLRRVHERARRDDVAGALLVLDVDRLALDNGQGLLGILGG